MFALVLSAALSAAPAPLTVAVPEVHAANMDASVVAFLGEHFAQELKRAGLKVVTSREMSALLGMERQKALLGCSDSGLACSAELASALGADAVMLTDLAKLGMAVRINIKAISGKDGRTLSLYSDRVKDEDAAADSLARAAASMAGELRPGGPAAVAGGGSGPSLWWAPVAAGGAVAAAGGFLFWQGTQRYDQLTTPQSPRLTADQAVEAKNAGGQAEALGVGLAVTGALAIAGGVAWKVLGADAPAVAVSASSGGAAVAVLGRWP